jgi:predicted ABC-type transport system involved in lysophospholipase L1 biosynthesis ATPase subunit
MYPKNFGGLMVCYEMAVPFFRRALEGDVLFTIAMSGLYERQVAVLDSKTGHEVLELFSELHRQGNTILIVTHDLEIASLANRQVEIHDGRIASSTEKVA